MRLVSSAFDSEVAGSTSRDFLDVNVWRGGVLLVAGLAVTDWSLSWDATRQVQGQASFTVADPDGTLAPWSLSDPLGPGGSRLQVTWVSGLTGTRVPLGWWRIRKADPTESWRLYASRQPSSVTLGAADRTNYVTDPRVTAWNNTTGTTLGLSTSRWFGGGSATGTHTLVTGATDGPTPELTSYGRKTWTNVTGGGQGDTGITSNNWTGYVQGAVYTASVWVRASVLRNYSPEVQFADAGGVTSERFGPSISAAPNVPAGTWVRLSMAFVAPNFAGRITIVWDTDSGTAWAVGSTLDITGFLVERVGVPLGAIQRTNLLTNPGLTHNATGWSTAGTGLSVTNTRETANVGTGWPIPTWYKSTHAAAPTGSPFSVYTGPTGSAATPVTPGTTYVLAAYVVSSYVGYAAVRLDVVWLDATGAPLSSDTTNQPSLATANAWERRSKILVAPAGAAFVRLSVAFGGPTGMPAGTFTGVTGVLVEPAAVLAPYFDGLTLGTSVDHSWTGTPGASSSVARTPAVAAPGTYFDGLTPDTMELAYSWTGTASASTSVRQPKVLTYTTSVLRTAGGGFVKVQADEETATAVLNRMDAEVVRSATCLAEVRRLLADVCPVTVDAAVTDQNVPASLVYSEARMDAVEDLLAALLAVHRMGPDGSFQVVPAAGVGPVWTLAGGDDGVLVAVVRALSDDQVFNAATSTSETAAGQPLVGRAFVTGGPLAWGGPFGKVPIFHRAIATTQAGVLADAVTLLQTRTTAGEVDLAVRCLTHPGVQVNDRVTVVTPTRGADAPITGRVITMDMTSAGATPSKSMDLTVRVSSEALEAIAAQVHRG